MRDDSYIPHPLELTIAIAFIVLLFAGVVVGSEAEEVERLAAKYGAEVEVPLWDSTRVDLLSASHAWEVDYSYKWAEGCGQALYYGLVTGKKPGLILLVRDINRERRYVYRAQSICVKHDIDLRIELVE